MSTESKNSEKELKNPFSGLFLYAVSLTNPVFCVPYAIVKFHFRLLRLWLKLFTLKPVTVVIKGDCSIQESNDDPIKLDINIKFHAEKVITE